MPRANERLTELVIREILRAQLRPNRERLTIRRHCFIVLAKSFVRYGNVDVGSGMQRVDGEQVLVCLQRLSKSLRAHQLVPDIEPRRLVVGVLLDEDLENVDRVRSIAPPPLGL